MRNLSLSLSLSLSHAQSLIFSWNSFETPGALVSAFTAPQERVLQFQRALREQGLAVTT